MSFFVAGPRRTAPVVQQRPLAVVATLGGAVAALLSLLGCVVVAVIGWYLSDAGAHGAANSGLRVGAVAWLLGHGSTIAAQGASFAAVPLGITAFIIVVTLRVAARVGAELAGHGPDADGLADGSRDLVVPAGGALFVAGYLAVLGVVVSFASARSWVVPVSSAMGGALMIATCAGVPMIAIGSGRARTWAAAVPSDLRGIGAGVRGLLQGWLILSTVIFLVGLLWHGTTALTWIDQAHLNGGSFVAYAAAMLLILPNFVVYAGSYVLGGPLALGSGTTVSLHHVVQFGAPQIGWDQTVPKLLVWTAASPRQGSPWLYLLLALPVIVAVLVAVRLERRVPAPSPFSAVVRALAYGLVASVAIGLVAWLASGSIGTGRMVEFGASGGSAFVRAVLLLALPAVVGAGAVSWWSGRAVSARD